ncbi:uncharacterized protein LOC127444610 isoform X2 [Myxocyprinus asiaticus]|uniref:uncharacterized protein LOC127444610 isoform X2 n=1 Tax=Myxocyprinus asiaticus TaxID=70543 RepID=UPI00222234A5|nr:uncharacterized protein LOC127444610 isoform X2 [Myxocyprinus asiaticus]
MHAGIYTLLLLLCVRSGSSAPSNISTCGNIRKQAEIIIEMLRNGKAQPTNVPSTGIFIPVENGCEEAKCAILKKLDDYNSCTFQFGKDYMEIKKELKGLIDNLQLLRCSKAETCNLPAPSCPLESMWLKENNLANQVISLCLQTRHVCPP